MISLHAFWDKFCFDSEHIFPFNFSENF
jgi:hypothetical protein